MQRRAVEKVAAGAVVQERPARVLLVDDHPLVRLGLTEILNGNTDVVVCGEAADAADAMRQIREKHPDLVIVDLVLKTGHGIELIQQIKAHDADMRVLVWSASPESIYAERALRAGAIGYISKEETSDSILNAVRTVLGGKVYLSDSMTNRMLHRVVKGSDGKDAGRVVDCLSNREIEVFEMLGRGLTTRQVAQSLHLSVKTIETYRENIKSKLGLRNSAELSHHAVQWVLEGH